MEKLSTLHFSLILVLLCWVVLKVMQNANVSPKHHHQNKVRWKTFGLRYLRSPWSNVGLPVGENMRRTISTSHSIDNSFAFFKIPFLLFENVTCRLPLLSNFFIFNFTLPILQSNKQTVPKLYETPTVKISQCHERAKKKKEEKKQVLVSCLNAP